MAIHIGTSGWSYNHWEGILYPFGSSSRVRLAHYCKRFTTVEVNNTFYRWPSDEIFAKWYEILPDEFVMTVKAARPLTHYRKLHDPGTWVAAMEKGLERLGEKRGVLLVQLPPYFPFSPERLEEFLRQASGLKKIAVEFRHPSWHIEETFRILEQYEAAYCVMSGPNLPCVLRATASFVYVRMHGSEGQPFHLGCYADAELSRWADTIRTWDQQGRDVWVFFNNDGHGYAVLNAQTLKAMLR